MTRAIYTTRARLIDNAIIINIIKLYTRDAEVGMLPTRVSGTNKSD